MKVTTLGDKPLTPEEIEELKRDIARGLRGAILPNRLFATIDMLTSIILDLKGKK